MEWNWNIVLAIAVPLVGGLTMAAYRHPQGFKKNIAPGLIVWPLFFLAVALIYNFGVFQGAVGYRQLIHALDVIPYSDLPSEGEARNFIPSELILCALFLVVTGIILYNLPAWLELEESTKDESAASQSGEPPPGTEPTRAADPTKPSDN